MVRQSHGDKNLGHPEDTTGDQSLGSSTHYVKIYCSISKRGDLHLQPWRRQDGSHRSDQTLKVGRDGSEKCDGIDGGVWEMVQVADPCLDQLKD